MKEISIHAKSELIDMSFTFRNKRKSIAWLKSVKKLHVAQNTIREGTFRGHIQANPSKLIITITKS